MWPGIDRRNALAFLVFGELCFGISGVLTKICRYPPSVIACLRMVLAGLVLTPFCIAPLRELWREKGWRGFLLLLIPGLLLGLHFQAWVFGLKKTSVASASFIFTINPVFFALSERLLGRRRMSIHTVVALVLVVGGAYWLFALKGETLGRTGDLFCFLAALLFVAYLLVSRRVCPGVGHLVYIYILYLGGGLLTLPFALPGGALFRADPGELGSLLALIGLALFPTLVGHTSNNYGVRHLSPLTVSFFSLAEPALATVTAALILGEVPDVREIPAYLAFLGAALYYLIAVGRRQRP